MRAGRFSFSCGGAAARADALPDAKLLLFSSGDAAGRRVLGIHLRGDVQLERETRRGAGGRLVLCPLPSGGGFGSWIAIESQGILRTLRTRSTSHPPTSSVYDSGPAAARRGLRCQSAGISAKASGAAGRRANLFWNVGRRGRGEMAVAGKPAKTRDRTACGNAHTN